MKTEKNTTVKEISISFAQDLIKVVRGTYQAQFVNPDQMLRSGASIGANICEAQASESRKDFIHKMKVAAKEAEETDYWLCLNKGFIQEDSLILLQGKVLSIKKMLSKIISTAISNEKYAKYKK
jgi:four helix bundle protein